MLTTTPPCRPESSVSIHTQYSHDAKPHSSFATNVGVNVDDFDVTKKRNYISGHRGKNELMEQQSGQHVPSSQS